ncbi:MAG: helix-turn-helix domain-containing protein [Saprospiraceae bacterium]
MKDQPKQIKFQNKQNANAQFDLLKLEELFLKKLNHDITKNHIVNFYIIFFVYQGESSHTIDFTNYKCSEGTLLTIRKDQIQKFSIKENVKGVLLLFTNEFLVSYLEEMETQKTLLLFNEQLGVPKIQLNDINLKKIHQSIKRIEEEYFATNDKHSLSIIRSELHILITQLFRIKAQEKQINFDKKYLKEFLSFQNIVENNITKTTRVQEYARMMGISTKTLNTVTRSIVHKSAKEFIDEICTNHIKRLLINTKLSIKEIAYQSGFEETTNFYKYFKRQTQTTPEQFRSTL